MLDRPRAVILTWVAVCFGLFTVLAVAVTRTPRRLQGLDDLGRTAEDWADDHDLLVQLLRLVEVAFSTLGMALLTAVLAGALLYKKHRRAALFTVAVMVATSLATTVLKLWLGRPRPEWQDTLGFYESRAFPSGHTSSAAAFAGIVIVLATMLVRRSGVRRLVIAGAVLAWLLVALDRVLLGRHYPTDVIAGTLLGVGFVLLGLVVIDPLPRSHAESADPLTEAVPSAHQLAMIVNPSKVEDVSQLRTMVSQMAVSSGWSAPLWYFTTVEDPGPGMAHDAALAGADLVLVCGGDGTVREVCAELAGTGIPVGIVPAGTGNLLARNLDIPLYMRAAVDVALTGQDRAIDLVDVSGDGFDDTHFMVMAGMGFDAAIMEGVNEDIKKRVGWFAYVISALRSLMFPAGRFEISVDDGEFTRHRARTVVVGNVGYLQAGMPLLPDATIDDGLLDVVILHPKSFFSWIPLAVRVLAKGRRTDDTINRMTGRTVVLRAAADTPRQLDGDSIGAGRELRAECVPGRLLVRVPR